MSVLIIAEAGVNHNGSMEMASQMVDVAADAGVDLVKFQTFSADRLVTREAQLAAYQQANTEAVDTQLEMLRELELSNEMHVELIRQCKDRAVGFLSTGFDIQSVELLNNLGIDQFKIPSGEITNLPYIRHIGGLGKPVILSTGMSELHEIGAALTALSESGVPEGAVTVLHCTSEYPAPMANVNLRAMQTIRKEFGVPVGYSDHTQGIEVAIAAVSLGATVIEKHFTLDRTLKGPDHRASLEPAELKNMVAAIRNIEAALGDGIKQVSACELDNRAVARKSLVAGTAISAGEVFSSSNVTVKRPGTGLSPMLWDSVIGQKAPRDFLPDEFIET